VQALDLASSLAGDGGEALDQALGQVLASGLHLQPCGGIQQGPARTGLQGLGLADEIGMSQPF
jgi:hypothetical protein